jgi:predicted lipoprotein with Yx(FWY)xxD motif
MRNKICTGVAVGVLCLLAACGGNSGSGGGAYGGGAPNAGATTAAPSGGAAAGTVSSREVAGKGAILVDAKGNALYFTEQEAAGKIVCTADCLKIWNPLTVSGGAPMAGTGVTGKLGTVARDDGSTQVTYDGKPLYTFTIDRGPGRVTGDGAKDSFGGTNFVWRAATVSGAAAPSASGAMPSATGPDGGGYSY